VTGWGWNFLTFYFVASIAIPAAIIGAYVGKEVIPLGAWEAKPSFEMDMDWVQGRVL